MRISEFRQAVVDEFGEAHGKVLSTDLVLHEFGDRNITDALAAGYQPRAVWDALCRTMDVPVERRHGVGRPTR